MVFWVNSDKEWEWYIQPEVGCNIAMFFLKVFGHFDFLFQVLRQEVDPGGSVWVRYLKLWNWDGKQAWKWEDAASYLMENQVPAADVLRKMEAVQLHDDGRIIFTLSTKVQVFTLGPGESVQFPHSCGAVFHFLSKNIHSISRFSHLELKCCLF